MTENQKSLITRLRRTGYGYKAIADAVNVSRDAVKSFCVRNNILHETNIKGAVDIDFCPNCYGALEHIDKHKKKRLSRRPSGLGRQHLKPTPWLTERHGYDPT